MPEELMKGFLEQTIECVDAFSDALNYILHQETELPVYYKQ